MLRSVEGNQLGMVIINHNYSIMPKINNSVDDLLLKSDFRYELTTCSNKPASLTVYSILSYLNRSTDSEVSVKRKKNEVLGGAQILQSHLANHIFLFQKTDFVKTVDDVKNKCVLETNTSPLTEKVTEALSIIRREKGSKLNTNFEPYVPNWSLEQVTTSSYPCQSDCDVNPIGPQEFYQKGRPNKLKNVWYVDSGCSQDMNLDFCQLHEVAPFNRGYVSFAGDTGGKISMKGTVTNGTLSFEDVYDVEELNHSLLSIPRYVTKASQLTSLTWSV
ncbi:hypothetical protein R6Q57_009164 [Mikania cordata]